MANERDLIGAHMTKMPVCISLEADLEAAVKLMQKYAIRHLPVLDGEELAGMVSDRDLAIIESLLPEGEWERIAVAEAMTPDPYCVRADEPLSGVAAHMCDHKYGSAVVIDDEGTVIGVFTTVDALRVLAGR